MSGVERYEVTEGGGLFRCDGGDMVFYDDHEREVRVAIAAGIRMQDDNQRLREALTGAGIWIKDVTNVVLFPLANEVQGGLGAEADSFGGCTPELLRGIDAALTTANGEVT
jgi:hypothetical protein